jgi:DHA1 family bicyclomycin/chloramphenicol resistance-like MFS transporter
VSDGNSPATGSERSLPLPEFIVLMATLISLVALSIDAMLPALGQIGRDLGVTDANDSQLVVTFLFMGLMVGQLIYGPLSDSIGRKPAIYAGLTLYMAGCVLSTLAWNFEAMLAGRLLQGLGVAAARIVTIALVRDQHSGRGMARIMSLVTSVFIVVPALAPILGQGILLAASWRAIFGMLLTLSGIGFVWLALRQPETLPPEHRKEFSLIVILHGIVEIVRSRQAFGYTVAAGLVFGAFVGYLSSATQVLQQQYALGVRFPFYFGSLALGIGAASYVNSRLVMRFGMRRLTTIALLVMALASIVFFAISVWQSGHPPLWWLMGWGMVTFVCLGMLFGNFNALAMEPLGHIAGIGAGVVSSFSTVGGVILGTTIGQSYDGTVLPLIGGFALLGSLSLVVKLWVEAGLAREA